MPSKRSPRAQTIDDYLAAVPKDARAALEKLRKTIQTAAPEATETISYQVPTFKHRGGLVAFAAFPDHCSFFVMSPKVMQTHAADLRGYKLGKATISFRPTSLSPPRWLRGS
jgi:uncharacterized protein YdhG (YjbR/CyaY superfamily)